MAKDIFNNHNTEQCQEEAVGNATDAGVKTGVTDTYGGGLEKGYQSNESIKPVTGIDYA
jgi:hypothetical protein